MSGSYDEGKIEGILFGRGMGCRIIYQDNVLNCTLHSTGQENCRVALKSLEMLLGYHPTAEEFTIHNGRIEFFKSYGDGNGNRAFGPIIRR